MYLNNILITLFQRDITFYYPFIIAKAFVSLIYWLLGKYCINNHDPIFLWAYFQFFGVIFLAVEWLGYVLFLCLTFWGMNKLVSMAREPFYIPTSHKWDFKFLLMFLCPSYWEWSGIWCSFLWWLETRGILFMCFCLLELIYMEKYFSKSLLYFQLSCLPLGCWITTLKVNEPKKLSNILFVGLRARIFSFCDIHVLMYIPWMLLVVTVSNQQQQKSGFKNQKFILSLHWEPES